MSTPPRIRAHAVTAILVAVFLTTACGSPQASPSPVVGPPSVAPSPPAAAATPSPTPQPSPKPKPSPKPDPLDQHLLGRRITVLIAGIDSSRSRARRHRPVNSDAMVVVSVNSRHNRIAMVSLPRDTVDVPLKGGGVWPYKINSLYANHGLDALEGALERTYGVPIDYRVALNMTDFGHLVDAVGGVRVRVPYPLYDPSIGISLSAGRHRLNGREALLYCRTRHTTSDFARQQRQQQVILAVFHKLVNRHTKIRIPRLLRGLRSLETNLPLGELPTLLEIGRRSADARVSREVLGPSYARFMGIEPNSGRGWVIIPDVARIRAYVRSVMR
jgi:LCP family protein required for cell wall assembly